MTVAMLPKVLTLLTAPLWLTQNGTRLAAGGKSAKKAKKDRKSKKAGARQRGPSDHRAQPSATWFGIRLPIIGLILLVLVIVSGVQVADQAHEVRRLHATLETLGKQYNALLAENTRLTLERGARASFGHVEQQAVDALGMHFPQQIVTVVDAQVAP